MADLTVDGSSGYAAGSIDSATTLVNNVSPTDANHVNGPADAAVQIETVLGSSADLKGNLTTLADRLAVALTADGVIDATGAATITDEDSRTNTSDPVLILQSTTDGTPSAGIGTGITFRAESADENPSDVGHASFAFSAVGSGAEYSYFDVWLRVAGAGLASLWRMATSGIAAGILTHANSSPRTYTFPDASMTVVGLDTTQTLTNKTIGSTNTLTACVKTSSLTTATGSASASSAGSLSVSMNDYSFFPATFHSAGTTNGLTNYPGADPSNTVGRFGITAGGVGTQGARWRYVTASDMPEIWISYDPATGTVQGAWASDDPPGGGGPGLIVDSYPSIRLTARDLEHWSILSTKASEADAYIRDRKLRAQHLAYRALQLLVNNVAPSLWLYENCKINLATTRLEVVSNDRNNS